MTSRIEEVPVNLEFTHRQRLLEEATLLVTGDRNVQYGEPIADFKRIASMLNALGFCADGGERGILPHDVAVIQICLKLSRISWSAGKRDSWADVAGYAGCGWECTIKEGADE